MNPNVPPPPNLDLGGFKLNIPKAPIPSQAPLAQTPPPPPRSPLADDPKILPLIYNGDPPTTCVVRGLQATIFGYPLGYLFTLFFRGAMAADTSGATLEQAWKRLHVRCKATGRNFAYIGGVWSFAECVIETYYGFSGPYSQISAACFLGAVSQIRTARTVNAFLKSCAGMSAFALAIEVAMGHFEYRPTEMFGGNEEIEDEPEALPTHDHYFPEKKVLL